MITCSKCNGPTKERPITTKFGPTTVGDCVNGCTNEKGYALGTFAPRAKPAQRQTPPGMQQVAQPNKKDEILRCLLRIEKILANPKDRHIAQSELTPDQELPEGF